jgi:hypothetical protein
MIGDLFSMFKGWTALDYLALRNTMLDSITQNIFLMLTIPL